jgi:PDZ domain-containing protein
MFALEVYNQLTEEDLTDGERIAGTGTIDEQGGVGPIGGIDKKVVAADNENIDVFFAPASDMASPSNYEIAKQTAENIGADMEIVPVESLDEALNYLKNDLKVAESKS